MARQMAADTNAGRSRAWDDLVVGSAFELGTLSISRDEIVGFATEFDPQPMHLDEHAAAASMLGGLAASGWQTCCLAMRMIAENLLGGSPDAAVTAVDEVRWRAPVRPGQTLALRATLVDAWLVPEYRDLGFVRLRVDLVHAQERLMTMALRLRVARAATIR